MPGYSGTPLVKKLGIRPGARLAVIDAPIPYPELVEGLPAGCVFVVLATGALDYIHLFVQYEARLCELFPGMKENLSPSGMLWISWPKRGSGIPTDLNENIIRDVGLQHGLVDVKVCAVTGQWSGLKFVYRLKDRSPA
jgi:hypothetical protein